MFFFRRAFAVTLTAAFVMASGTMCIAAKKVVHKSSKKVSYSRGGVVVPSTIRAGSAVAGGRAFYRPSVPEDSLAGIRLGRPAKEVLSRWGNPSRITVGTADTAGPENGTPPMQSGPAYIPAGGGANPYASLATQVNRAAGELGINPVIGAGGTGLPPLPPYAPPGMPGSQPQQNGTSTSSRLSVEEVTWTYDLQNGITLEFIITDGLITQITVGGVGPWGLSKTRTGLQLGDTYKLVLWVCGYPENQKYAGRFLRVSYVNKSRALYTFLNKKLVGVTIAMVPNDLN